VVCPKLQLMAVLRQLLEVLFVISPFLSATLQISDLEVDLFFKTLVLTQFSLPLCDSQEDCIVHGPVFVSSWVPQGRRQPELFHHNVSLSDILAALVEFIALPTKCSLCGHAIEHNLQESSYLIRTGLGVRIRVNIIWCIISGLIMHF
jgi:hypothetical protein